MIFLVPPKIGIIKIKIGQLIQKINLKDFLRPKKLSFFLVDLIVLVLFVFAVTFTLAMTVKPNFRSLPIISNFVSFFTSGEEAIIESSEIPSETEKERRFDLPSKFLELIKKSPVSPTFTPQPTQIPIRGLSPTPTLPITLKPTSTSTLTPTPTPTPTRTPNPPIINISYPSEMQSIEMNTSQTFCLVDIPAGGDTSGLQRKHNINDKGWFAYVDIFTLCFDPKEGLNRISLQYKNSYGDESAVYTRQFNFHRIQDITVTISGQIYRDENCNKIRDGGESNIEVSAIVRIFKMPEFYVYSEINSNSNGFFSFSATIHDNESITLQPLVQSPPGYKSNPNYKPPSFTLNSENRNASLDYPQVPNEFVGQCQ